MDLPVAERSDRWLDELGIDRRDLEAAASLAHRLSARDRVDWRAVAIVTGGPLLAAIGLVGLLVVVFAGG